MNDVFIERMVKKKFEGMDAVIMILILLGGIVLMFVGIILMAITGLPMIPLLVLVGVCFGGYKLITMRNLEFEYSLTNGYVSVDKIMNRSARKRLTAFECKEVEDIGEYAKNQERLKNREVQTRIFATALGAKGENSWYVIVNAKKTGRTLLVFDPDEDLLNAVKKFIPAHLRFEVFGRGR